LREFIHIDGMPLHIIDTAGLHESDHIIEKEAMRRALFEINRADHVLWIQDITETTEGNLFTWPDTIADILKSKPVTIIKNKIDLRNKTPQIVQKNNQTIIYLSAKLKKGIDLLKAHLKTYMGFNGSEEGLFIARRRHLEALNEVQKNVVSALAQLKTRLPEVMAEDLRLAQKELSKITGEFTSEDLLSSIFSIFCIGK
jgi:tRNA modification GTPase